MSQLPETPPTRSAWECQSLADSMRARLTIYKPKELASLLDISLEAVLTACKRGELKHRRVNSRVIKIESLDAATWWTGL